MDFPAGSRARRRAAILLACLAVAGLLGGMAALRWQTVRRQEVPPEPPIMARAGVLVIYDGGSYLDKQPIDIPQIVDRGALSPVEIHAGAEVRAGRLMLAPRGRVHVMQPGERLQAFFLIETRASRERTAAWAQTGRRWWFRIPGLGRFRPPRPPVEKALALETILYDPSARPENGALED